MGRGNCPKKKRNNLKNALTEGKTYAEIGHILNCSYKMMRNALVYTKNRNPWKKTSHVQHIGK